MKPILYYYEHCPYCIRVLAVLQMAAIDFEPIVLLNNDEETPIRLIGQKMLPILQKDAESYLAESLDIIDYLCQTYDFTLVNNVDWEAEVIELIASVREENYGLSMPRWVKAPLKEFATSSAVDYFINKKTQTIGDFDEALANSEVFIRSLKERLNNASDLFERLTQAPKSKAAIILFSGLYGLHYVKGLDWPPKTGAFMQKMSALTKLPV